MLVGEILNGSGRYYSTINEECSQFIHESAGFPVYRALPQSYNSFHKVKVRTHRRSDDVSEAFNSAFKNEFHNIVPRSIFTQPSITESYSNTEPFYVFPINGYKFIYSKGVQNSNENFRSVLNTLKENVNGAFEMTADLIKYSYVKNNLVEGITSDSEIIFYGIPYFYAVRVADVPSYTKLINR